MFKKFAKSLRSFAAPAVIAVAGLFAGEQAQAANINLENGTVTVEGGDALDKIINQLEKQGVETTRETFQSANPTLTNVNNIQVGQVLNIPGLRAQASSSSDPTAEEMAAATDKMYELFSSIERPSFSFSGLENVSFNPFTFWSAPQTVTAPVVADVASSADFSDLGRELLMNAVATAQNADYSTLLLNVDLPADEVVKVEAQGPVAAAATEEAPERSILDILSDEELLAADDQFLTAKMVGTLASYSEAHLPQLLAGYKLAIEIGNATNMEIDGEQADYDRTLTVIPEEMIAAEIKARHADWTDDQIARAVQGYQVGAQHMTANDKPCDNLTEVFFEQVAAKSLSQQPEVVQELMAATTYDSYDRGLDDAECDDNCGPEEEIVRPQPRPADLVPPVTQETYSVKPGDALCSVVRAEDRSFEDIVAQNNMAPRYLLKRNQILDLTNVGELDEEDDALFKEYCTGTGPLPVLPPVTGGGHPPSTPVTPTPVPPVVGECRIDFTGRAFIARPISSQFNDECGCSGQTFDGQSREVRLQDGRIVRWPVWGNPMNQCPRDNDDPTPTPTPEEGGGGCQTDGCGGGGPNDDLGGDRPVGGGGNTPPGPNPGP